LKNQAATGSPAAKAATGNIDKQRKKKKILRFGVMYLITNLFIELHPKLIHKKFY